MSKLRATCVAWGALEGRDLIVQKAVERPLCLLNRKIDFRLRVAVRESPSGIVEARAVWGGVDHDDLGRVPPGVQP